MKIILKKVGQEPEIVELDIDKNNGFQVSRKFIEVLGADYATDRMALDSEAGIYLYVAELGEGHNFDIKTNNPYYPTQPVLGDCLLTRYMNIEGDAIYGDMTENELDLMKALVDMDYKKASKCIEKAKENLTTEERALLEEEMDVKRRVMEMLRGF
jgi:hypothetical protein